ncbi:hypothetical protein [Paraflavitalea sp. CAU 1676]|uniref:hypothetical protein n=1 Tax=Paraflavitalea sp. CAU 1676 TaxID=3032598 RepID=UPI0023DAA5A3|nr:hypothetical protein [Paraflavitalea sp. CAU 1676]MDF2188067.1 hypothetical protein [Paraflavitalea sp. CAU 1676]
MPFVFIILLRILFVACMVFIIGYVFGGFSKKPALVTITKVAVIMAILLFITTNFLSMRAGFRHQRYGQQADCGWYQRDSVNAPHH